MPAITVDDITVLPRVRRPDPGLAPARPVAMVTTAPQGFEGEGFPVRRAFAGVDQALLDPFIMMDQMGEVDYAPGEPRGTSWHPHRGFETVTYIIDGSFIHQDSHGGGGVITNGDTQWMTAGSGLLHIETPPEELVMSGGLFHGLQLWVNLPRSAKMNPPRYQDLRAAGRAAALQRRRRRAAARHRRRPRRPRRPGLDVHADDDGARDPRARRVDDASRGGATSTRSPTCSPAAAPSARSGARCAPASSRSSAHGGSLTIAADAGQDSHAPALEVVLLGGEPIREPVAWYGPVRHEHPARAHAGRRGLPEGPPRRRPRRRHPALPRLT